MIGRRQFIALPGGVTAWPLTARAQQRTVPLIGILGEGNHDNRLPLVTNLRRGLSEPGYVEGRNLAIDYRWTEDDNERFPDLAADLARRQVAVIVTAGIPAARAAQAATRTIPIVFGMGGDPVRFGLVASLSRPGGNITGMSTQSVELTQKRLELLHELVPAATVIGLLVDPTNPNVQTLSRDARAAATALGLQIQIVQASGERDLNAAFAALDKEQAGALVIANAGTFNIRGEQLGALAARRAMPTIFQSHEFAAAGGLISYGDNSGELFRQVGIYTGRILKGEKPSDLPVQISTRTELIINLKTAKALGITVPPSLLARADEVIE